ncbi:MAG TPA: D-aminoacylase [Jatrophihabitantaceae bacterium]
MSLLLTGGLLVDGTGQAPWRADVLVRDGRIARIVEAGVHSGAALSDGVEVRDVSGSIVCPGFVDIHTHSDLTVLAGPAARSKVHQGVTTEVVGNCGLGVAPLPAGADVAGIRRAVSYLDLDPALRWNWPDTAGYLDAVTAERPSLNVATLTGHLPLRAGVVGFADRAATTAELHTMQDLLAASFEQGSVGLSTGLAYAPLCYAAEDELEELARVVAEHDRFFAWHVRDYADDLVPSVQQALRVGERAGCRVQISHLVVVGRRNWGSVRRALDLVDAARDRGLPVGVDIYPYLFGNAPLSQMLPPWAQEGGAEAMAVRLRTDDARTRIRTEWQNRPLGWDEVTISRVPEDSPATALVGRTVGSAASADPDGFVLDLLAELGSSVLMIAGGRSEDDLRTVLDHPATVVASDGLCLDPDGITGAGAPHPRSYGCFPRFLARYAERSGSGLARAVAQCTAAPALIAGLADRGVLREQAPADLVVYSPDRLADRATFEQPQQYPDGIELVLVGGEPVIDAGRHTGRGPGSVLRGRKAT